MTQREGGCAVRATHGVAAGRGSSLRVLVITRLFPNRLEPFACPFQRQQLAALSRLCHVEVAATIPYLAGASLLGSRTRAARLRGLPLWDDVDGIRVLHARVPYVPGVRKLPLLAPFNVPLYVAGLLPYLPRYRGRFDVVLGTFLYPDACAASHLAGILGLPYGIKAHGTDVNIVARWPSIQSIIAKSLRSASFAAGVSHPMVEDLIRLGTPRERAVLLPNGVDRTVFRPVDRFAARKRLGLPVHGRIVLYAGRFEDTKGVGELLSAFLALRHYGGPPTHLVMAGEGPLEAFLQRAASERFGSLDPQGGLLLLVGQHPLPRIAEYLGACDVLALPSWGEGTPNVVLEALAVGRPVVASRVGGVPFVVEDGRTGILVPPRDVGALSRGLLHALETTWDEAAFIGSAPPSWEESAEHLYGFLKAAVERRAQRSAMRVPAA